MFIRWVRGEDNDINLTMTLVISVLCIDHTTRAFYLDAAGAGGGYRPRQPFVGFGN